MYLNNDWKLPKAQLTFGKFYESLMVTTQEKLVVDTQKLKRKELNMPPTKIINDKGGLQEGKKGAKICKAAIEI